MEALRAVHGCRSRRSAWARSMSSSLSANRAKRTTLAMVHALEKALQRDINQLDWMTPATKKRALEKLHAIANKIGFPGEVARLLESGYQEG